MSTANLKLLLCALGVGSLFPLVCIGKVDANLYVDLIGAAITGLGAHAAGKGAALPPSPESDPFPIADPANAHHPEPHS